MTEEEIAYWKERAALSQEQKVRADAVAQHPGDVNGAVAILYATGLLPDVLVNHPYGRESVSPALLDDDGQTGHADGADATQ